MDSIQSYDENEAMVDPFLVEALQNPRHRLTILRMELDIQRFLQSPNLQQFEFQHYPTSYLRLAAHRVAQHYGLQTMVQDNGLDGLGGNRILVRKITESRYPAVRLSEIHAKQSGNDKPELMKLVIRPRPNGVSANEANGNGIKRSTARSVEERKEEYEKARARIFSSPSSPDSDDILSQVPTDGKIICLSRDENENSINTVLEPEKSISVRDGVTSSRVAIFRDMEKDRTDPDYDRSYERYVRNIPAYQSFSLPPCNMENLAYVHYDTGFSQLGQMPRAQASLNYRPPSSSVINPLCAQAPSDVAYIQWPSASMMYAHSYEQFRHAVFQVPFCQQPLSFDYSQNH